MSSFAEVYAIVEGGTEEIFISDILAPYLAQKNIYIHATQITKPGEKGGDVKFKRAKRDIGNFLKQRDDTYVTTFVDYYGVKEWPGTDSVSNMMKPDQIAALINKETSREINELCDDNCNPQERFIPYICVHEFESLLFSDLQILSEELSVKKDAIESSISAFKTPEAINNSRETAPSKRLEGWYPQYKKTVNGIEIAKRIGVDAIRIKCPVFDAWIRAMEKLVGF